LEAFTPTLAPVTEYLSSWELGQPPELWRAEIAAKVKAALKLGKKRLKTSLA
jgi:hypothetical protein